MLKCVTLTGADDSIDPMALAPHCNVAFVEWGILVGSRDGLPRFPSAAWLARLHACIHDDGWDACRPRICLHLCGRIVRQVCSGNWAGLLDIGPIIADAQRIQLNFHGYQHLLTEDFGPAARRMQQAWGWQIIFQVDGVNDQLGALAYNVGLDAVPLYDLSGGAGVVPDAWPRAQGGIYSGYAGGLGPDNLAEQLPLIRAAAHDGDYWIDMETKIRSNNDQQFDLDACQRVLDHCAPWINHPD